MNDASKSCHASLDDLVADVVDQFMERVHRGEQPCIEDYTDRHPEAAALLRQILPALQVLQPPSEEAGASAPDGQGGTLGDFRILREVGRGRPAGQKNSARNLRRLRPKGLVVYNVLFRGNNRATHLA